MNDDDYWQDVLNRLIYNRYFDNAYLWSASDQQYLTELSKILKEPELPYYNYNRYDSTRDGEVAKAALEALEQGLTLEQLLKKDSKVRGWWSQHVKDRVAAEARALKERERREKAAEKKKIENERRREAASKLTDEELAAFGLRKDGYHKR